MNKSIKFRFPKKSVPSIFKYYVIVSAIAKLLHSRCLENNLFMEIIQIVRAKLYTTFETYIYVSILKCSISLKRPHYEIKSTNHISSIMIFILCFDPWNYKKQPPTPSGVKNWDFPIKIVGCLQSSRSARISWELLMQKILLYFQFMHYSGIIFEMVKLVVSYFKTVVQLALFHLERIFMTFQQPKT